MLEIEITETNIIEGGIEVFARVWKDGLQIGFGRDGSVDIEKFSCINPPVLVPDGTTTRELDEGYFGDNPDHMYHDVINMKEDPEEALLQMLESAIDGKKQVFEGSQNIIVGKVGRSTLAVNPDEDDVPWYYDSSNGYSWSVLRAKNGNNWRNHRLCFSGHLSTTTFDHLSRPLFRFDTSTIGGATIDSATFKVYLTSVYNEFTSTEYACLTAGTIAGASIAQSDFQGTVGDTTELATTKTNIGTVSTGTYDTFILNAGGESHINGSGDTVLGLKIYSDGVGGGTPTAATSARECQYKYYGLSDGSLMPTLTVEYTAGTPPTTNNSARRLHMMMM